MKMGEKNFLKKKQVNSRLRRTGQPYLLKELLDMVFAELCHMVTPRFRLRRARFERTRTGTFNRFNRFATGDWGMHGRDLEDEGTGTDLEDEGTGTDD
jgi:hypothetical protein